MKCTGEEQLDLIEAALRLLLNPPKQEPEVMPPDQATESVGASRRAQSRGRSSLG